jgi:hypothetical protein
MDDSMDSLKNTSGMNVYIMVMHNDPHEVMYKNMSIKTGMIVSSAKKPGARQFFRYCAGISLFHLLF